MDSENIFKPHPVKSMCSTREGVQYLEENFIQLPFIKSHSRILHTLTATSGVPQGYCGCASRMLHTLMSTAHLHGYCTHFIQGAPDIWKIVKLTQKITLNQCFQFLSVVGSEDGFDF